MSYSSSDTYKNKLQLSREQNRPIAKPYQLSIGVWGRCNSHCAYCLNWQGKEQSPSSSKIINIFLYAKSLGITQILFSGGEPTLRPDLLSLMEVAENMGFNVLLITNGIRLDKTYIKDLGEVGCKKIGISFDSFNPKLYKEIRGVEIEKPLNAIKELSNLVKSASKEYRVSICVTISKKNIPELVNIFHRVQELNLAVQYQPLNFDEDMDEDIVKSFWPDVNDLVILEDQMVSIAKFKKQGYAISNRLEFLEMIPIYFKRKTFHPKKCYTPYAQIILDQYMNIKPCWAMPPVGNVLKNNLQNIWFSRKMQEVRKIVNKNKCPGCSYSCHLSKDYIEY